ncbi:MULTISPECIES: PTS system mannose/fructose/sorbose family transporter subunit IID [Enterococcus]|uniref:PTS system mannose/fructose/sorbose family transporter subunit IID n=1 Tax=Enterococcus TaxID=1350 RepID=UPI0010F62B82|nr:MULTISPECIES: PTS system mannose/fructose/sorbose family transporter subunit IID [Enterococcus]KAF1300589.1 PTS mannose transporter subunit IID [Enterococcus sp. JM9B]
MMTTSNNEKKVTKKDLINIMWRSLPMEFGWTYERQMHLAFAHMMAPLMKKLYGDNKDEYVKGLQRHMEFFNCTPQVVPFIGGVVASMEETKATTENFDESSINSIKTALMGPLSGIGDSIFIGTIRVIATGLAASLAKSGNVLGPILFLLIYNIPGYVLRYYGAIFGYKLGIGYLDKIEKSGMMDTFKNAASILGVMVIGAMTSSMVYINMDIKIGTGESTETMQSILDGVMPGILSLAALFIFYYLNKKNVNVLWQIIGATFIGIVLTYFGVLGV